jgi:hypothetical protein
VAPTTILASIALVLRVAASLSTPAAVINTNVQTAVATMVNDLGPGATLFLSAIVSVALAVPGVTAVNTSALTINGSPFDLIPSASEEIRTAVSNISVTNY